MQNEKKIIFKIKDLKMRIGNDCVNYGTFDICGGDFIILQGHNGSGKSTFLKFLTLDSNPDNKYFYVESGSAVYNAKGFPNISIEKYSGDQAEAFRRDVVYIGQEEKFIGHHSAYDALRGMAQTAVTSGKGKYSEEEKDEKLAEIDELAYEYFEKYGKAIFNCEDFDKFRKRKATSFSGGQMKMLSVLAGVIKAKVCNTSLIIMDEPLNNLDAQNKYNLNKIFSEFRNNNIAILIITHCQIFDGINRVLNIKKGNNDGESFAELTNRSIQPKDCLNEFKENENM